MERTLLRRERLALTFLSYCAVVIFARGLVFFTEAVGGAGPRLIISGLHIHHFFYGIGFLLLALFLHHKSAGRLRDLQAILVGVGLGLVFDETSLWLPLGPDGYWAVQNFFLVVAVGVVLMARVFPVRIRMRRRRQAAKAAGLPAPRLPKRPDQPYISVVVPAYNEGQMLARIAHEFKKDDSLAAFGGLYTLYSGLITARLAIAYLSLPAPCGPRCSGRSEVLTQS